MEKYRSTRPLVHEKLSKFPKNIAKENNCNNLDERKNSEKLNSKHDHMEECNKCCMANAFLASLGHVVFKIFWRAWIVP